VRREVFDICFPMCQSDDPFQEHPVLGAIYNFNSLGYLPYFIPVVANYGRWHRDQRGKRRRHIEKPFETKYYRNIRAYRKQFFKGKIKHCFRDGASEVIGTIDLNELKCYKKRTREYRITQSIFWRVNLAMLHKKIRQYGLRGVLAMVREKMFMGT